MKMLEKQRVRFSYGIGEKQFARYVREANDARVTNRGATLYVSLEHRLDNVVFRAGFGLSRQSARQLVSHGHIDVNGKRVSIPSYRVSMNDIISIRARSLKKPLFSDIEKRLAGVTVPSWLALAIDKREAKVTAIPKPEQMELSSALSSILEFYKR